MAIVEPNHRRPMSPTFRWRAAFPNGVHFKGQPVVFKFEESDLIGPEARIVPGKM
jgi:hypothetical protein